MDRSEWFGKLTGLFPQDIYTKIIQPDQNLLIALLVMALLEVTILLFPAGSWIRSPELLLSLSFAISTSWFASRLFKRIFDFYILDAAIRRGSKIGNEILLLIKLLANVVIIIVAVLLFAQTHQINVIGLLASLGIGGLAVAFAAQKILEQVLGGIVLYLDRPFVVDDYIGLSDGTFGRVESIGLRSTKIRTSGKGTLVIVPNNVLIQSNIENFTGAKKVMSILNLTFRKTINREELALIRQIILKSTQDIFGIDSRNTEINFTTVTNGFEKPRTQAQITFFILGSGDVSMELRRQLLDLATHSITQRLEEYGVEFDIHEPTVYIDSPITI